MTTFCENYCAARGCRREDFASDLFWRSLHRHAVVLAPVVRLMHREHFDADHDLLTHAARARSMKELNDEIRDFMHDGRNHRWWRMRARLRVSTQRLRRIARDYLTREDRRPV